MAMALKVFMLLLVLHTATADLWKLVKTTGSFKAPYLTTTNTAKAQSLNLPLFTGISFRYSECRGHQPDEWVQVRKSKTDPAPVVEYYLERGMSDGLQAKLEVLGTVNPSLKLTVTKAYNNPNMKPNPEKRVYDLSAIAKSKKLKVADQNFILSGLNAIVGYSSRFVDGKYLVSGCQSGVPYNPGMGSVSKWGKSLMDVITSIKASA